MYYIVSEQKQYRKIPKYIWKGSAQIGYKIEENIP